MTLTTSPPVLGSRFAQDLPELSLPWQAEAAPEPRLLALDEQVALELGLDVGWLRSEEGVAFLLGTAVPAGATPVAQAYAGHQFGGYSPRLGDGRALLLGDLPGADGQRRDLHLKGSGRTPFSRGGDGRAVVGPMLREHVMSTAMHALGVPTTRSLAVVATGRSVAREDGALPGALLARVASSHLRVGSFQYARALEDVPLLRRLLDHAVALHHPEAADAEVPALALYEGVLQAQAELVARWMHLGFVHGVMNTDNVTISGETIDYGPCAFLDAYDPAAVYSSIDQGGRYAYGNQPSVTAWNLARFAESLLPLLAEDPEEAIEVATAALGSFPERYAQAFVDQARPRLGLRPLAEGGPDDDVVRPLVEDLLTVLREARPDHTGFWRDLAVDARGGATPARDRVLDLAAYDAWAARWHALGPDADLVARTNPAVVPRNHLVEAALEAATAGDLGPVERLLEVLRRPYDPRPEDAAYLEPAPADFGGYTTYCGT